MIAADAFAAAADGRAFPRGSRINDLVFQTAAFGATHKTTANCGRTFVSHSILRCQGTVIHKRIENLNQPGNRRLP
jgi:hypothetical protein